MKKSTNQIISKRIPFVHSLLASIGEEKVTKEQAYECYIGYRPGVKKDGVIKPPADLLTVEVYLLTLADRGYLKQDVIPWGSSGTVSLFVYHITDNGRMFLNRKK